MGQGLFYYIEYMNNQLTENYLVKRSSWPSNSIFVWIQAYLNYMDFGSYFWLVSYTQVTWKQRFCVIKSLYISGTQCT